MTTKATYSVTYTNDPARRKRLDAAIARLIATHKAAQEAKKAA